MQDKTNYAYLRYRNLCGLNPMQAVGIVMNLQVQCRLKLGFVKCLIKLAFKCC